MKITELKPGDIIFADGGFNCIPLNRGCEVKREHRLLRKSELYVQCCDGRHYLDGQLDWDDHETIVGFSRERWPQ